MKIAIAGAGAMGGRFGAMLYRSGEREVVFIDRWAEQVKAINERGLTVTENGQSIVYPIPAFFPEQVTTSFDLIILFTKAMQMDEMLQSIQHVVDDSTFVLVLSNGIGNIETIEKYVPAGRIIAGVTIWSSELDGPGRMTLTGNGSVTMQAVTPTADSGEILQRIIVEMNRAGLNASAADDVIDVIWKKAALNSVLNTLTALLHCDIEAFGRTRSAHRLTKAVLDEFTAVAKRCGIHFDENEAIHWIEQQFDPAANGRHHPSMYQDLEKHRPTEVDYLNGYIVREGQRFGIPTPVNAVLTDLIHAREDLNAG